MNCGRCASQQPPPWFIRNIHEHQRVKHDFITSGAKFRQISQNASIIRRSAILRFAIYLQHHPRRTAIIPCHTPHIGRGTCPRLIFHRGQNITTANIHIIAKPRHHHRNEANIGAGRLKLIQRKQRISFATNILHIEASLVALLHKICTHLRARNFIINLRIIYEFTSSRNHYYATQHILHRLIIIIGVEGFFLYFKTEIGDAVTKIRQRKILKYHIR